VRGNAVPVVDHVATKGVALGIASFAIARNGTLVYRTSDVPATVACRYQKLHRRLCAVRFAQAIPLVDA
jgi:hypothetical protein